MQSVGNEQYNVIDGIDTMKGKFLHRSIIFNSLYYNTQCKIDIDQYSLGIRKHTLYRNQGDTRSD